MSEFKVGLDTSENEVVNLKKQSEELNKKII